MNRPVARRQSILSLAISEKHALYAAYIPFLKNGGLFIPTDKQYQLGDEVFVLLTLMDETERLPFAGHVCWITPQRAEGNRTAGIGVQFGEPDGTNIRNKIENYLAGALESEQPTHTM